MLSTRFHQSNWDIFCKVIVCFVCFAAVSVITWSRNRSTNRCPTNPELRQHNGRYLSSLHGVTSDGVAIPKLTNPPTLPQWIGVKHICDKTWVNPMIVYDIRYTKDHDGDVLVILLDPWETLEHGPWTNWSNTSACSDEPEFPNSYNMPWNEWNGEFSDQCYPTFSKHSWNKTHRWAQRHRGRNPIDPLPWRRGQCSLVGGATLKVGSLDEQKIDVYMYIYMDVSENSGTPNHPF